MASRSFFEHALPLLLDVRADGFRALGARFCFELAGEGGGAWTLDCGKGALAPRASDADTTLRMSSARFEQLMTGHLDVALAERQGALSISGDRSLWARLAVLLRPLAGAAFATATPEPLERVLPRA
jgi:SCP-2 sterol transfer family